VRVPRDAAFSPRTNRILKASHLLGGVEPGPASAYALEIDSPTAVRTLNALMGEGLTAELALAPSVAASGAVLPTGSAIFAADPATKVQLASIGRTNDVSFQRVGTSKPPTEPIDRMPRILVLTGALNQDVWSLQNLGFTPQFMSTAQLNAAAEDPLPGFDVIWNTGGWPGTGQPIARQRLTVGTSAPAPTVRTSSRAAASSPGSPPPPAAAAGAAASFTGTTSEVLPARSPGPAQCATRRSWTHPPGSPPCRRP